MKQKTIYILSAVMLVSIYFGINLVNSQEAKMEYNTLTPEEERVILHKGTERAFTGIYNSHKEDGTYICKRCDEPLFRSEDKFDSQSGWPSFDDAIPGAVKQVPDADGMRTEIVCDNCGAHLGHVFTGERFTDTNVRHCVNSISLNFLPAAQTENTSKAYFAGGCFWGVEYYFQTVDGVLATTVGYMGGHTQNPTYKEVCSGNTGHIEAMEVVYDPSKVSYEELAKLFFEIHDPTQIDRQGPDIGEQYKSAVFYTDDEQKEITEKLIGILEEKDYKVATELIKAEMFWPAEFYHQDYYKNNGKSPYCHFYTKKF